ncbi:hypothetical protein COCNU_04G009200 [Cocos nucifera]|uniref:Uncharacterized protein n=1 Tax=Cocos nucifera TaxID=13894 RepID=A0A8K0N0V0_COCNU|nr:hypothetical protein COCNU_04G009200 [Cocos nucifera]
MVEVTIFGLVNGTASIILDSQTVLNALLKVDRYSDPLRRIGWTFEEITDMLDLNFRLDRRRQRPPLKLPLEIVVKFGKIAEAVCRS